MANEEIIELFETLLEQEQTMLSLYTKLLSEDAFADMKESLSEMAKDESKHIVNARKMIEIVNE